MQAFWLFNHQFRLIFCVFVILCFSQFAFAQSGRRATQPTPTPTPTPTEQVKTPTISEENQPSEKIESLVLTAEIQDDAIYSKSNYADRALKECQYYLEFFPKLKLKTEKGGEMNFKEAKERAEKETTAHVLWINFVVKSDSYGNATIDYVEYIVLKPQTAKKLTFGRLTPESLATQRRILGLPNTTKRSTELTQIKEFSREIMEILIHGGWVDR